MDLVISYTRTLVAIVVAFVAVSFTTPLPAEAGVKWEECPKRGKRITCVVDGDTFWFESVKYRIYDIDTPETNTRARCKKEERIAQRAKAALIAKLSGGPIRMIEHGVDNYGRFLVTVKIGRRDIGRELVKEGLAVMYSPSAHQSGVWC